jgi:hypothetical protein
MLNSDYCLVLWLTTKMSLYYLWLLSLMVCYILYCVSYVYLNHIFQKYWGLI